MDVPYLQVPSMCFTPVLWYWKELRLSASSRVLCTCCTIGFSTTFSKKRSLETGQNLPNSSGLTDPNSSQITSQSEPQSDGKYLCDFPQLYCFEFLDLCRRNINRFSKPSEKVKVIDLNNWTIGVFFFPNIKLCYFRFAGYSNYPWFPVIGFTSSEIMFCSCQLQDYLL